LRQFPAPGKESPPLQKADCVPMYSVSISQLDNQAHEQFAFEVKPADPFTLFFVAIFILIAVFSRVPYQQEKLLPFNHRLC
jgi:hypothetical protein